MIHVPIWLTNVTYLVVCYFAAFQLVKMDLPNVLPSVQFIMIAVSLIMMLLTALYSDLDPWLSLFFFAVALGCAIYLIRAHRYLPPRQSFE